MEATRRAIRAGRRLASDGDLRRSVETWKAALGGAYELQDYAGMFVLAKNLGEVCVQLATEEQTSTTSTEAARSLLQEALEYFDYALELIDQCSLRDALGGYRVLYHSVRSVEAKKAQTFQQIERLRRAQQAITTVTALESQPPQSCTTCGVNGEGDMMLDSSDGCYYCKICYEEYYAVMGDEKTDESASHEELAGVAGLPLEAPKSVDEDQTHAEIPQAASDTAISEVEEERRPQPERLRSERVELGSLADLLGGNLHAEDQQMEYEDQREINPPDSATSPMSACCGDDLCEGSREMSAVVPESDGLPAGERLEQHEDALEVAEAAEGTQYSIAQLLEMRKQSPSNCPEAIRLCPVWDDGSAVPPSRPKANGKKKVSVKKTTR
ncbi:hypothetical protein BBJ28_00010772 [Nothophytophthora sp. Chile5]|nr:hypothetical protein BBJ28_00010772 [Nothophytophthora sp. Chile5]